LAARSTFHHAHVAAALRVFSAFEANALPIPAAFASNTGSIAQCFDCIWNSRPMLCARVEMQQSKRGVIQLVCSQSTFFSNAVLGVDAKCEGKKTAHF